MHKFSMKAVAVAAVIGGMMASAVSASAALNLPTQNCSYVFNTNMKLGSTGTDVMNLQKVLNAYPQTRVADTGAGSPGMETTYFGPATTRAVNKFHALHLVELGITAPTGNAYAGTRALLNQICSGSTGSVGLPAGCTSTSGFSTTTGVPCNSGTGSVTLPAGCTSTSGYSPTTGVPCNSGTTTTPVSGPVSVMLSSSQPSGTVVAGQAAARIADLSFSGNGTVTAIELQRIGVSSDTTLSNVYLYDGNTRISDAASVISGGYIRFNSTNGLFAVNGSRTISVRADILSVAQGASAGQTVGVKLNSMTTLGGSQATYSNVSGNLFTVAVVSNMASVNITDVSDVNTNIDAGTTNLSVFNQAVNVNQHNVNLRAATFRFIGSAPVDSVANLSLYVDSVKIAGPMSVVASNDNKVTFDLGSSPYVLQTGSHTIELRGDIVKGSSRTITFTVENAGDLLFEDSQLAGVYLTPTVNNNQFTRLTYNTFNVNAGSVIVNTDTSFSATTVTGGSSNATIGQFTFKAYGEDVKVSSLSITPNVSGLAIAGSSTPVVQGLSNVTLYVNGGQIGTSQNWTTGALTFNVGSSLVIPAGQTVTVAVKADLRNTNGNSYTAGTIGSTINQGSSNGQGQSSYTITNVPTGNVVGTALTVSSGAGTFARTSGFTTSTVSPNTTGVKVGSFTLQAGSSEGVVVTGATVYASTTEANFNNISNLSVRNGSTVLANPSGLITSNNSFSFNNLVVPANSSMTFDVYADIGNAATNAAFEFDMSVNYRGQVSNTTASTTADGSGAIVSVNTATLGTPTVSASSPVSQFVVGGSTYGIATFTLKTGVSGTSANVRELRFAVTGADAIESITVGGVTASVVSGTSTVTGLNIPVAFTGTDVPVTVKYSGFRDSTTGGSLSTGTTTSVRLTYVEATSGSGTVVRSTDTTATSNNMYLVASKPIVAVSSGNTNTLILGAENKVGEFTVTADANGKISVATTTVNLSANGFTGTFNNFRVAEGNATISSATVATTSATTAVINFNPNYEISAGQSKTFSLFAYVAGTASGSNTPYVASNLSAAGFQWRDVIGGNVQYAGTYIYNFPTNSYTTQR